MFLSAFAMSSCTSNDNYLNAIPEDAMLIQYVNAYEIVQKAALSEFITPEQIGSIADVAAIELGGEDGEYVKNVITDLSNSGIDIKAPLYAYVEGDLDDIRTAVVAKVLDKEKIDRLFEIAMRNDSYIEISKTDGSTLVNIDDEIFVGYNSTAFIAMVGEDEETCASAVRAALVSSDGKRTGSLPKVGGADLSTYMDMGRMLELLEQESVYPVQEMQELKKWVGDSYQMTDISFTEGHITMNHKVCDLPQHTRDYMSKFRYDEVGNVFMKYLPKDVLAVAALNFDGKEILQNLLELDFVRDLLIDELGSERELEKNVAMIRPYVESFAGDLSVALTSIKEGDWYGPEIGAVAMAEVEGKSVLSAVTMFAGSELSMEDDNSYSMEIDDMEVYIGQQEDMLYAGIGAKPYEYVSSAEDAGWLKDVDGARFYAAVNLNALLNNPVIFEELDYEIDNERLTRTLANTFDYMYMCDISDYEFVIDIALTDEKTNSLKKACDILKPYVMEELSDVLF